MSVILLVPTPKVFFTYYCYSYTQVNFETVCSKTVLSFNLFSDEYQIRSLNNLNKIIISSVIKLANMKYAQ